MQLQNVLETSNSKIGDSDGIVNELLKYGGSGMVNLLEQLFSVIWQEEIVPRQLKKALLLKYLRKGIRKISVTIGVSSCLVL